jgi:Ca2+-binding RTX toxin-like protein
MAGVTTTTVAMTAVWLGLSATVAPAAFSSNYHHVRGTMGVDRLRGTQHADLLSGRGGGDIIRPASGADIVRSAGGADHIYLVNDGIVDRIHCGTGFDVVSYHFSVDQHDILDPNCEGVVA